MLNITITISYILFVTSERLATKDFSFPDQYPTPDSICYGETQYDREHVNEEVYWFMRAFALIIDIWLIVVICKVSKVLSAWSSGTSDYSSFIYEKFRINLVMTCFVISYALQNVWVGVDIAMRNKYHFWDVLLGSLVVPCICNFIPILLVLYGHFRNITSLAAILKFSWKKDEASIPGENSLNEGDEGSTEG